MDRLRGPEAPASQAPALAPRVVAREILAEAPAAPFRTESSAENEAQRTYQRLLEEAIRSFTSGGGVAGRQVTDFGGLVLGSINADFCDQIVIFQHF